MRYEFINELLLLVVIEVLKLKLPAIVIKIPAIVILYYVEKYSVYSGYFRIQFEIKCKMTADVWAISPYDIYVAVLRILLLGFA